MRKNLFRFILLSAFVATAMPITLAQAKEEKSGTASISGRVTRGDKPLAGILVLANRANSYGGWDPSGATTKTDEEGRYQFTNLAAGQYLIRPRALAEVFAGVDSANYWKPLLVQDGEAVENFDFVLAKGGVITGTITDENGKPLVEANVQLFRKSDRGPSQPYSSQVFYLMNKTDDRGVYRLFGLLPGKYLVSVGGERDNDSWQRRYGGTYYPQTFYPGVTKEAEAKVVEVAADSESAGIDIKFGKAEKTYTARGRIIDAITGAPIVGVGVGYYKRINASQQYGSAAPNRTNAQGEFQTPGLNPGSYIVYLMMEEGLNYYVESQKFEILNSDVSGLELKATTGSTLSGRVVVEGTKDPALTNVQTLGLSLTFDPTDGQSPRSVRVSVNPDGSFRVAGLGPGKARFLTGFGQMLNSRPVIIRVEKDGKIWSDEIPISTRENAANVRVVVGYGVGIVRGEVKVIGGQAALTGQVFVSLLAQPKENSRHSRTVLVDGNGRFYVEGLVPGEYQIVANFHQPPAPGKRRKPTVPQPLTVTGEKEAHVTLTLDLTEEERQ